MNTITKDKAKELIRETNGLIFSSTFIKKDNTIRTLTARLGKRYKSKTGKQAPYKATRTIICYQSMICKKKTLEC